MTEGIEQLFFNLAPQDRYALSYLVRHSGIAQAVMLLESSLERLSADPLQAETVFISGPKGSGKTHVVRAYGALAREREIQLFAHEFTGGDVDDNEVSAVVNGYERVKAHGGLVLFSAVYRPAQITENPHLRSRLVSCQHAHLEYPREEELRPLIFSLLERHNLKLSDANLEYLLRRLPRDPLSFDNIFGRISASSLRQARPAGQTVVREAISKSIDQK